MFDLKQLNKIIDYFAKFHDETMNSKVENLINEGGLTPKGEIKD